MTIAIDFDGTIVENKYPGIGEPMLFAFETLRELKKEGHNLVLWTYRSGKELNEAVEFCRNNGIEFYAVNKDFPEENYDSSGSRKIQANIFIDDRNIGGFLGWSKVWQLLHPDSKRIEDMLIDQNAHFNYPERKTFFYKLKQLFT
jgi:hypothetical protein